MKISMTFATATAVLAVGAMTMAPATASAQSLESLLNASKNRQNKKNEWRNIAIGAGALGVIGLLRNDSRLFFAGAAGSLYSAYRYEQDRKSQNKLDRARASYFARKSFTRDGHRYERRTVRKNGKTYYRFVRVS